MYKNQRFARPCLRLENRARSPGTVCHLVWPRRRSERASRADFSSSSNGPGIFHPSASIQDSDDWEPSSAQKAGAIARRCACTSPAPTNANRRRKPNIKTGPRWLRRVEFRLFPTIPVAHQSRLPARLGFEGGGEFGLPAISRFSWRDHPLSRRRLHSTSDIRAGPALAATSPRGSAFLRRSAQTEEPHHRSTSRRVPPCFCRVLFNGHVRPGVEFLGVDQGWPTQPLPVAALPNGEVIFVRRRACKSLSRNLLAS